MSNLEKKTNYFKILQALSENEDFNVYFQELYAPVAFQLALNGNEHSVYDLKKISQVLKPIEVLKHELKQYQKNNEEEVYLNNFHCSELLKGEMKVLNEKNERKYKKKTKSYSNEDFLVIEKNIKKHLKTGSYDHEIYPDYVTVDIGMFKGNIGFLNPFIHQGKYLIPKDNLL
jgi:hypothetical protein